MILVLVYPLRAESSHLRLCVLVTRLLDWNVFALPTHSARTQDATIKGHTTMAKGIEMVVDHLE